MLKASRVASALPVPYEVLRGSARKTDTPSLTRVPAHTSDAEAATLPMNCLTARMTLDRLRLTPGQAIAVTGAAGVYGGCVVQLAKAAGLIVIANPSEEDEDLVRGLGADVVVRRGAGVAR